MSGDVVKLGYDGLVIEPLPSGNTRYRVRVRGDKRRRITFVVGPDHPEFHQIYLAAREGIKIKPSETTSEASKGTVEWLVDEYLAHLKQQVDNGQADIKTLKQRKSYRLLLLNHKSGPRVCRPSRRNPST